MADRASRHSTPVLLNRNATQLTTALVVGAALVALSAPTDLANASHRREPDVRVRAVEHRHTRNATGTSLSLSRLSLAQLAGQRIIYSYGGLTPPQELLTLIRNGEAAGVIFFSPNIASPQQLRAVVGELQAANTSSPVHAPLLMMTDQEGGLVRRLPGAPLLSEKQIGASPKASALASQAGTSAGENLRSVGLNVNLAPVLDVYRQAGNFIDEYQRSYGSNPELVSNLGGTFITAQQQTGVAATAKHFPGLGTATTDEDTDTGPVTLDPSLTELRSVDEVPFQVAITAGVKLVMVSWATYPALDARLPAGLSSAVIHGELRGRLDFRGVTITDSLDAGALDAYGDFAQRAVLAAHAGADLLLCSTESDDSTTLSSGLDALEGLVAALANNRLDRRYAEEAAGRVISLRSNP